MNLWLCSPQNKARVYYLYITKVEDLCLLCSFLLNICAFSAIFKLTLSYSFAFWIKKIDSSLQATVVPNASLSNFELVTISNWVKTKANDSSVSFAYSIENVRRVRSGTLHKLLYFQFKNWWIGSIMSVIQKRKKIINNNFKPIFFFFFFFFFEKKF